MRPKTPLNLVVFLIFMLSLLPIAAFAQEAELTDSPPAPAETPLSYAPLGPIGGNLLYDNGVSATAGIKGSTIQYALDAPALAAGLGSPGTPNAPAISLTKTVGTVPGVCAATDQVTVPYGASVYYCYQIENTGSVTMTVHTLVDDQLGALATNLPYELPPGAFSPQVIVPDAAIISVINTATWTAASSVGYTVDTNAAYNYISIKHPVRRWRLPTTVRLTSPVPWRSPSSA